MSLELTDLAKRLLDNKVFAVVTTLHRDGRPHSTVIWAKRDGNDVVFSTTRTRRKALNLHRDPRASVTFFDVKNPYQYVSLEGTVTMSEEGGRALIDELSLWYNGQPYPQEPPDTVRMVCRFTPTKQLGH